MYRRIHDHEAFVDSMSEAGSALEHSERGLDDSGDSDGDSGISIPQTPPVPQSTLSQRYGRITRRGERRAPQNVEGASFASSSESPTPNTRHRDVHRSSRGQVHFYFLIRRLEDLAMAIEDMRADMQDIHYFKFKVLLTALQLLSHPLVFVLLLQNPGPILLVPMFHGLGTLGELTPSLRAGGQGRPKRPVPAGSTNTTSELQN
ncbi:hypothetical protein FOXB_06981 [Fusarium oxysporum f. sp. conglutinans Fo5176]|uniref:Uncharacterized protein n=1 Tax=Fusarium oxysporum (strain Fo5176) TaxID=660025 RepID=F9FKQ2_FUSOF|nr:hypothetical protein FOXB_06981 [Fusarium oxysporum f. sp. conglutinans Fo5176]